ncbi:MAG: acyl-[acyl-carrier-protein]--UDP-N-acetylglucosamine O-acyltransferase [Candidatus Omnitrophica bacterium CG11_big_fil_rev_8_21_14_0_20_45_26]|uniref:Acyl-[acyl-carrier-protein]--UDP-N-acetylglucosamine O-acyltransferase n=1 Tax=Candidatus Abzuiibacterium crystallinum TaxID=1974748 RepID=A0A2H0LSJ8_9BACT|nr:MAG: acyl-[acyl-carrier-protein]--UDP-N-acetylglucosamine O-acyltransferase [Candidatus Omnitrophica bacterium CG11_big_fil_rev_8_21_14_0_20_45_26]PIW64165.1 MAG: acyl-[acyl-carrier-protein]--UDP-N-acetylglucosamine O-acyltransferase [Candidatus Omnitrophica bacterium CG12_big_fil_rev_8_21_14_0_65_45_16]
MKTKDTIIHPTAIVDPAAELGIGVEIGPYAVIEGTVKVGDRTKLHERVSLKGHTYLGSDNEVFTGAVLGSLTQDKKYKGGVSYLKIGSHNKIREYVTMNPGTEEGTETVIGDRNLVMAYAHIAHDCILGNDITVANNGTLAGHVVIEDRAILGGFGAVHQFVRIGYLSIVGGCSKVVQDIPPFIMADGHPAKAFGLNSVGLERANVPAEDRSSLKKAFKILFRSGLSVKSAAKKIESEVPRTQSIQILLDFLSKSERSICK